MWRYTHKFPNSSLWPTIPSTTASCHYVPQYHLLSHLVSFAAIAWSTASQWIFTAVNIRCNQQSFNGRADIIMHSCWVLLQTWENCIINTQAMWQWHKENTDFPRLKTENFLHDRVFRLHRWKQTKTSWGTILKIMDSLCLIYGTHQWILRQGRICSGLPCNLYLRCPPKSRSMFLCEELFKSAMTKTSSWG
jgi:hypothetical protein